MINCAYSNASCYELFKRKKNTIYNLYIILENFKYYVKIKTQYFMNKFNENYCNTRKNN